MTHLSHLGELESAGLVRLARVQPEVEYVFRHALLQEAAYESLIKRDRKDLHLAVGEAMEAVYSDRSEEFAPVLAGHFHEAGDRRALGYFVLAGDAAYARHALPEAVAHYRRALEAATPAASPSHHSADGEGMLTRLYSRLGRAFELSSQFDEALRTYEAMQARAKVAGDRSMELAALISLATLRCTPTPLHDPPLGQALLDRSLSLARELGDRAAEARVLWNLMLLDRYALGDYPRALRYGEASLAIARELNLREQLAYTLNDLPPVYAALGQTHRGLEALAEARELWRALDNLPMLTDNLSTASIATYAVGEYERAIALSEEAHRISQSIGHLWGQAHSRMVAGRVYLERGQPRRAIEVMQEALTAAEQSGHPAAFTLTADLGWTYGVLGDLHRGLALARQALAQAASRPPVLRAWSMAILSRLLILQGELDEAADLVRENPARLNPQNPMLMPGIATLSEGELALAQGDSVRAVEAIERLLARLRETGTRALLPDALRVKAMALLAQAQTDDARAALGSARAEAEALGVRFALWPIIAALSEIEARRGRPVEARALLHRTREIVEDIAAHCPPDLQASFLAAHPLPSPVTP